MMYIISNVNEDAGLQDGHAWIRLEGNDGTVMTMSLWGNQGEQEFWVDLEKDFGYGEVYKSIEINENQYKMIGEFNNDKDKTNWTPSNTCAGYSSNLWYHVTGERLSASDYFGTTTPRSLSESILRNQGIINERRRSSSNTSSW